MTRFYQYISYKMPKKLLYFAVIQAWALATTKKYTSKHPDEVTWSDVCKYLEIR
jgi:hypothetical protein